MGIHFKLNSDSIALEKTSEFVKSLFFSEESNRPIGLDQFDRFRGPILTTFASITTLPDLLDSYTWTSLFKENPPFITYPCVSGIGGGIIGMIAGGIYGSKSSIGIAEGLGLGGLVCFVSFTILGMCVGLRASGVGLLNSSS